MYDQLRALFNDLDSRMPEKATSRVPHGWKCRRCYGFNHWYEETCGNFRPTGPCPGPGRGEKTDAPMIYNEAHVYLGCGYEGASMRIPGPEPMSLWEWDAHLLTVMSQMRYGTRGYGWRDWGSRPRGVIGP